VSLIDWFNQDLLIKHKPNRREIRELLRIVQRDLTQCCLPGLDRDWRLGIAYNAALQLAVAALLASGYRAKGEAHHYRVIQSLAYTANPNPELIDQMDGFRKMRNVSDYERAGAVTEQAAQEILALAQKLQKLVSEWLHVNHPELI
jgi:hypothetical protein